MVNQTARALPPDFSERARNAWAAYQREYDVASLRGQVAAVDPESGRVWTGPDALDAVDKMNAEGVDVPVWCVRIGYEYLDVKGHR